MVRSEIARRVGMSTYRVCTWLKQGAAPVHRCEGAHQSIFDPYASYVLDQWQAGVHDGLCTFRSAWDILKRHQE